MLLCAATLLQPVCAAVRWGMVFDILKSLVLSADNATEIVNRNIPQSEFVETTTAFATTTPSSNLSITWLDSTQRRSHYSMSTLQAFDSSSAESRQPMESHTISAHIQIPLNASLSAEASSPNSINTNFLSYASLADVETIPTPRTSNLPNSGHTYHDGLFPTLGPTSCDNRNGSSCNNINSTITPVLIPVTSLPEYRHPSTTDACILFGQEDTPTIVSVVYTSTTTIYGNASDYLSYTHPYDPINFPPYCEETASIPQWDFAPSWRLHSTRTKLLSAPLPSFLDDAKGLPFLERPSITFVTTDKNPSVVFSTGPIPRYSQAGESAHISGNHKSVVDDGVDAPLIPVPQPRPVFTVTAGPDKVVIGKSTFINLKPSQTSIVVVDGATFTIYPTAIVGQGATVGKPSPAPEPTDFIPIPISTIVGGIGVSVSGSIIAVDGITLTIPPQGLVTTIKGENVIIGPGHVVIGKEAFTWPARPAQETNIVVRNGGMVTAIGQSVVILHSITITYGPGFDLTTLVVDDDTITIAPSGVVIRGITLGGPSAALTDTKYEIVGGLTVTEVGSTLVVIGGTTYTIGQGAGMITTLIEGEPLTIGPDGLIFNSMTFGNKDSMALTTSIEPSGTWLENFPKETGAGHTNFEDEDDASGRLKPDIIIVLCIAFGVFVLG